MCNLNCWCNDVDGEKFNSSSSLNFAEKNINRNLSPHNRRGFGCSFSNTFAIKQLKRVGCDWLVVDPPALLNPCLICINKKKQTITFMKGETLVMMVNWWSERKEEDGD